MYLLCEESRFVGIKTYMRLGVVIKVKKDPSLAAFSSTDGVILHHAIHLVDQAVPVADQNSRRIRHNVGGVHPRHDLLQCV